MQNIPRNLLFFLPRKIVSHWFGVLMHVRWPAPVRRWSVRTFAKLFAINLHEAEKSLEMYDSVGDLFVRCLKPGMRPIDPRAFAVHPADSVITQSHRITSGHLIQAKGRNYSIEDLVGQSHLSADFEGGWTLTYYLCPTDYHRVHSPMSGKINRVTHIPGTLWPVNEWSVNRIDRLFAVNERLVVEIETERGLAVLVMVGATNVGKMELVFDERVKTNFHGGHQTRVFDYSPAVLIEKGAELGLFRMGSTVVMLYPQSIVAAEFDCSLGPVKVGEKLF